MKPVSLLALVLVLFAADLSAASPGDPAIGFSLPDYLTGKTVSLDDYAGQVVYLDFWASWCGPCRKSFPFYDDLYKRLGGEAFTIIAVSLDENPSDALRFLDRNQVEFPVVLDPSGGSAEQWRVSGMPSSFLIDTDQKVAHAWVGFRSSHENEIEDAVRTLLQR